MTNLETSIIMFALFALFGSPICIRQYAQRAREEHSWAVYRSSDGCLFTLFAFTYGLFLPLFYLAMILDDLADPTQIRPEPGWFVAVVIVGAGVWLLVWGLRLGRFVRALLRSRR